MSFDTYAVAVKLSLVNDFSKGLASFSGHIAKSSKDVDALQARLDKLKRFTLIGGAMSAGGIFGLGVFDKMIKPAEDYAHQINIMNMAGMKQVEIADAVGSAWKLAGDNITTTATGNLKALLDLRNVTGSLQEAKEFLPIMQRMQTVLAASKEGSIRGNANDLAFSAMKALDIRGAVNDPEKLKRQADLMTRVIEATQGKVTPEQFQSVFNYARQAKFAMSDDFAYKILPTLMLENASKGGGGGGSKGVGPAIAAMYRVTNQGYINRKSLGLWEQLGEVKAGTALKTSTPGTVVAPMVDASIAAGNQFEFNKLLVDKIYKKFGANLSDTAVTQILNQLYRGNQLAGSLAVEFFTKRKNFERDQKLLEGTMDPAKAYKMAMSKDPETAKRALSAAWENFETSLTLNVVPILVPALFKLSKGLNELGAWARHHPNLTKDIVIGFGALSALLAVGGPIITGIAVTRLAFGGLGGALKLAGSGLALAGRAVLFLGRALILNPIGLTITAIAGAVYLLWKNWGTIGPKVTAVWDSIKTGIGGVLDWLYKKWEQIKSHLPSFMFKDGSPTPDPHTGASPYIGGQPSARATINNTIVLPDHRVLARVVTEEQSRVASRPTGGTSGFDGSMHPRPVGAGGGW